MDALRAKLKSELLQNIETLGQQNALFPGKEGKIVEIARKLETLSPILNPFVPQNLPTLLGDWQLIYASQGTVPTILSTIEFR